MNFRNPDYERSGVLPAERERKRLLKRASATSEDFGVRPHERSIAALIDRGMVVVDKPAGPSSHQVAAWVRDCIDVPKAGHGGTLDPRVTGVLPVATARGTKAVQGLLSSGKEYLAVLRLHDERDIDDVLRVAKKFTGKINQTPPVRSAVKRRPRYRRIYYHDVLEMQGKEILLRVGSQAGTYIRTLCVDMGRELGTRGQMQELRRTRTGLIDESQAVSMMGLRDGLELYKETQDEKWIRDVIRPVEGFTAHMEKIVLRDTAIEAICHGAPLAAMGVAELDAGIENGTLVALESLKGELIGLATSTMTSQQIMDADNGVVAVPDRIVMPQGTYPKVWKKH